MTQPRAIDVHAHVVVPEVFARTARFSLPSAPAFDESLPEAQRESARRWQAQVVQRMSDVKERIVAMNEMRVAKQVLSPSLVHQCTYELEASESLRLERVSNDHIAAMAATEPSRFVALGSVPFQAPDLAVVELTRCRRDLGFRGVSISTYATGHDIGHPDFDPFWKTAADLDAVIYVHPAGNREMRFQTYSLWNSVGQCFEETMAIASLMYEGVLERYPTLKICFSHGGGYMPHNMGRIDRNWIEKPATRVNMSRPPIDYLKSLWFDSCVYDTSILRNLIAKVGSDRVVLGSDYPVGNKDPVGSIEGAGLDAESCDAILFGNAEKLLAE